MFVNVCITAIIYHFECDHMVHMMDLLSEYILSKYERGFWAMNAIEMVKQNALKIINDIANNM